MIVRLLRELKAALHWGAQIFKSLYIYYLSYLRSKYEIFKHIIFSLGPMCTSVRDCAISYGMPMVHL